MSRLRRCLALALLLAAGCDPKVTPAEVTQAGFTPAVPSKLRESCAATADCEAGLLCVDAVCRPGQSSRLGDYYWAAGAAASRKGELEAATVAFQQAIGQFEAEKLAVPPGLLCEYGAALRQKPRDPKAGEQAARFLHRCLLAAVPGTAEYRLALAELAELEAQGLDPALLAREAPADAYLTRPARKPAALAVAIVPTTPSKDKGYAAFTELVRSVAASGAMARCYDAWWTATQKPAMAVDLQMKYRVTLGDDDIVIGSKMELTGAAGLAGADAAASQCVRDALAGEVTTFGKDLKGSSGNWQGALRLTLSPGT